MQPRAGGGRSGRRSVTKSRLGGGEEARPPRSLPTLYLPRPAREEEQFVYLGLQESCPPPGSPRPPGPSSLPSSLRAIQPSPASSTFLLPLLFLLLQPALLLLPSGTRPWGREREALCPPCGPAQLRRPRAGRRAAAAALHPARRPRVRRGGGLGFEEQRVSQSRGRGVGWGGDSRFTNRKLKTTGTL